MKRTAKAIWKGTGMEGGGSLSTLSGAFKDRPYSFKTRFKNEDGTEGTNPEELIAAAHAGCYSMAMSFALGRAGFTPETINTEAVVKMENVDGGFKITLITLNMNATVPGIDKDKFQEIATAAKDGCPISQALAAVDIKLNAKLN